MLQVIAIFDVGKTNKKLFLINDQYEIVHEISTSFDETLDEDGFPCENIEKLNTWLLASWEQVKSLSNFEIVALNFSGYGASFVQVDETGKPVCPLYNYLKPYSDELKAKFYQTYGGEKEFSKIAASPILGNLNSGMQLYSLKYEKPEVYSKIHFALHLPQYLSSVFTKQFYSEITSIGCHTNLWDFQKQQYHQWVSDENIDKILPEIVPSNQAFKINNIEIGVGLHDSSSALIPYLIYNDNAQFLLISTGTWCISLNPFNNVPLSDYELEHDTLCFLQYNGNPVKASRLFAGQFHEDQTKRIAAHFNLKKDFFKFIAFNDSIATNAPESTPNIHKTAFENRNLTAFDTAEKAYHQLISDLVAQQVFSTDLVLRNSDVTTIFVDGGFSKNEIYMHLLAKAFPNHAIFAAEVSQASAIGAALIMHEKWNTKSIPNNLISIKKFNNA